MGSAGTFVNKSLCMSLYKAVSRMLFPAAVIAMSGCGKGYKANDYTAFFGGEVNNPTSPYVVLYNQSGFSDTLKLDKNNRFFGKIDSLPPGLYMFKHEPEYQYVYFDKNDSLLVTINPQDFDNSIVFSGRGDEKNNFLMDMFLVNEKDRNDMFTVFDKAPNGFLPVIDAMYHKNEKIYEKKKCDLDWSDGFDAVARASVDYPYFSKKELYPVFHRIRTGDDIRRSLPAHYYDYRNSVHLDDARLQDFAPYTRFISYMLNNMAEETGPSGQEDALENNINKLHLAAKLLKNENIRNTILNQIAFNYLIEDQNLANNQRFLSAYYKYSTDRSQKNEIVRIGNATKNLQPGDPLPEVPLIDTDGKEISSRDLVKGKSVIFFWTNKAPAHTLEAHKLAIGLHRRHPDYRFIAVNLDDDASKWKATLNRYDFSGVTEVKRKDFDALKSRWAIIKIHRTMVTDADGNIATGFTSLFDNRFEDNLK